MSAEQNEWHIVECGTSQFQVPKQYEQFTGIGHGAFGTVA